MKKIMIAALGLSFLTGSVVFAQDTASSTTTKVKKHKKSKKSTATTSTSAKAQ